MTISGTHLMPNPRPKKATVFCVHGTDKPGRKTRAFWAQIEFPFWFRNTLEHNRSHSVDRFAVRVPQNVRVDSERDSGIGVAQRLQPRGSVSPTVIGDHAATIRNRPGSVPIPVVTAIIAVIVIVSRKAKKETKRRSVEIRVSIIACFIHEE